jgi:hypothetical protein
MYRKLYSVIFIGNSLLIILIHWLVYLTGFTCDVYVLCSIYGICVFCFIYDAYAFCLPIMFVCNITYYVCSYVLQGSQEDQLLADGTFPLKINQSINQSAWDISIHETGTYTTYANLVPQPRCFITVLVTSVYEKGLMYTLDTTCTH